MSPLLRWTLVTLALAAGLNGLDRLGLWAEARGWIYWRHRRPRGNALGAVTLELQRIFESGKVTHLLVAQERPQEPAPDPGSDPPPPLASAAIPDGEGGDHQPPAQGEGEDPGEVPARVGGAEGQAPGVEEPPGL